MNDRAGGVKGYAEGAAVRLWPRFSCTSFWDRGAVVALRRGSRKAIAAHHEYLGSGLLAERLEAVAAPVHSDGPWHHPTRRERFPAEARRALGQETVADAVDGEEVTDLVGVGFEFLPELHHVRIHGAGVGEEFVAPDVETENRGQPVCRLADTWSKQFPGRN